MLASGTIIARVVCYYWKMDERHTQKKRFCHSGDTSTEWMQILNFDEKNN